MVRVIQNFYAQVMASVVLSACSLAPSAVTGLKADSLGSETANGVESKVTKPTLTGVPKLTSNDSQLKVKVTGADLVNYYYYVASNSSLKCPAPKETSSLAKYKLVTSIKKEIVAPLGKDGPQILCVVGVDTKSQLSEAVSATWVKDTIPPALTLKDTPSNPNAKPTLEVTVTGEDATHYKYAIVDGTSCSTDATYSAWTQLSTKISATLTDGNKTLCVKAKDIVGNESLNPTFYSWMQSGQPPTAVLTNVPTDPSNTVNLNITVGGIDVVSYKYSILAGSTDCTNANYGSAIAAATPIANDITGLADGVISVCVLGINQYGTTQKAESATIGTWTKNTYIPTAVINNQPASETNVTPLAVTINGTGVTEYQYALVTTGTCTGAVYGAWLPIATPITNGLTNNDYLLCVLGKDNSGNFQVTPTSYGFEFDNIAPTVTLTTPPPLFHNVTPVVMTVSGTDVMTYQFTFEDGQTTACSSVVWPGGWTAITTDISQVLASEGAKRICVRGKDGAGNIQTSPTTVDWTHDITPPTATFTAPPAFKSGALNITIGGTQVTHYKYSIVPSATACTAATYSASPIAIATPITDTPSDGATRLCVKGIDTATNEQITATEATWTQDNTVPVVNSFILEDKTTNSTSISNAPSVNALFNVTEANTIYYCASTSLSTQPAVGDGCWTTTHPVSVTVTNNQTVYGWVKDAAGNITAASVTDSIAMTNPCNIGDLDSTCTINANKGAQTNNDTTTWEGLGNLTFASGAQMTTNAAESFTINMLGDVTIASGVNLYFSATIIANNMTVTGNLRADGVGYNMGAGTGASLLNTSLGASGASHYSSGGQGGDTTLTPGALYGDLLQPVTFGSGGGCGSGGCPADYSGGKGGGRIRLNITNTLTVNGLVTANALSTGAGFNVAYNGGGGSGGSIYVTTATLTGSGSFKADGSYGGTFAGVKGGGGSGGIIAVYYTTGTGFTGYSASTAAGGVGYNAGSIGAVGFYNEAVGSVTNVTVYKHYVVPSTMTTINTINVGTATVSGARLAISKDAVATIPGNLTVQNSSFVELFGGATLTVNGTLSLSNTAEITVRGKNKRGQVAGSWQGAGGTINAATLTIDATSKINANGEGYIEMKGPGGTSAPTVGLGASGASHLTAGAQGGSGATSLPGTIYGVPAGPVTLGSGGGCGNAGCAPDVNGGYGGGAIKINVTGTFTLSGSVTANALNAMVNDGLSTIQAATNVAYGGGGGSGGSIWIIAGTLSGSGTISVAGSAGGTFAGYQGAGGAGGVIHLDVPTAFAGTLTTSGGGGYATGALGAVLYSLRSLCDSGSWSGTGASACTVSSVKSALTQGYVYGGTGDLVVANGGLLQSSATQAIVLYMIGDVTVQNGGAIKANLYDFIAANITVDSGGSINADGMGYQGVSGANGNGPGYGVYSPYNNGGQGGTHAGLGGTNGSAKPGFHPYTLGSYAYYARYGNASNPTTYGSAGGGNNYNGAVGGAGGGAIKLSPTGTFTINGTVSAKGAQGTHGGSAAVAGSGAGGSIRIASGTFAGTGTISSEGGAGVAGSNASQASGAGGGGYILISTSSLFAGTLTVAGGTPAGDAPSAEEGFIKVANQDQMCVSGGTWATSCTINTKWRIANGATLSGAGSLIIANGGEIKSLPEELITISMTGSVTVQNGGAINANLTNLSASSVTIDAGGKISADALGYKGVLGANGTGSGYGYVINYNVGGGGASHAGRGGKGGNPYYASGGITIYGNATAPTTFGSSGGGGYWTINGIGGNGGGAIKITTASLVVEGTLSANGQKRCSEYWSAATGGSGAGGSIWVTGGSATGAGIISTNGADGCVDVSGDSASGGAGGGGYVYLDTTGKFTGSARSFGGARAGAQAEAGQPGLVTFSNANNYCNGSGTLASTCTISQQVRLPNSATLTVPGSLVIASGGDLVTLPGDKVTISITGDLTVQSGGKIRTNLANLSATNITIDGIIDVSGLGTPTTLQTAAGTSPGTSSGYSVGAGGGGHGGAGGNGETGYAGGVAYGSATAPVTFGSSGGAGNWVSSFFPPIGGGAVKLTASNTLTVNGSILANGASGSYRNDGEADGGGSGGSIYLITNTVAGSGVITANGGSGTNALDADGGGGAGGRIALQHNAGNFSGTKTVIGGLGPDAATDGDIGTICVNAGGLLCDSSLGIGLKVWLDASQSVAYDGSNNVTNWVDQSGNGNDAEATAGIANGRVTYVASESITNNKPVLHFDGTNGGALRKLFSSALTLPNTIIIVGRYSGGGAFYDGYSSSGRHHFLPFGGGWDAWAGADLIGGTIDTNYNIFTTLYNSTDSQTYQNGGLIISGSTGTQNMEGFTLGAAYPGDWRLTGDIAEFIVYNRQLSTSERQKVEGYLAAKYDINVTPTSNRALWLRSDKGLFQDTGCSTAVTANGQSVGCWADQSGQNRHATQATAASRPTYLSNGWKSKPTLDFDGTDDTLSAGNINSFAELFTAAGRPDATIIGTASTIVGQYNSVNRNLLLSSGSPQFIGDDFSGRAMLGFSDSSFLFKDGASLISAVSQLVTGTEMRSNGSIKYGAHGLEQVATLPTTIGSMSGLYPINGEIAEVVAYNTELTSSDRNRVEAYLKQKHGGEGTLSRVLDAPGLKMWFKADAGIVMENDKNAKFTSANSESLSIADNASLSTGDIDFSIAGWFYLDSNATTQGLVGKWQAGTSEYELLYDSGPGVFAFYVSNNGAGASQSVSSTVVTTGKWYFIVASHDSVNNQIGISINNGTFGTSPHSSGVYDGSADFLMGSYNGGLFFDGKAAKVGFWKNRVLTAADRTALYNSGKGLGYGGLDAGLKTNLISYWMLREASGTRSDFHGTNHLTDNNTVTNETNAPGSTMSSWNDQSGFNHNATQSTASKRPHWIADGGTTFNNKPVVRFSGSATDLVSMDLSSYSSDKNTVFVVARQNDLTNGSVLLGKNISSQDYFMLNPTNITAINQLGHTATRSVSNSTIGTIAEFTSDGSNQTAFVNGVAGTTVSASGIWNPTLIGGGLNGNYFMDGEIAEIIIFNKALTTAKRQAIECYLSVKYNITLTGVTCP